MTASLGLVFGAAVIAWFGPAGLRALNLHRVDPMALIVGWCVSFVGVLLAGVAGIVLLFLPGHGGIATLMFLHRCWAAVRHGSPPGIEEVAGIVALLGVVAVTVRVAAIAIWAARRGARRRREQVAALRLAGHWQAGRPPTLWLPHERPLAFSLRGGAGMVVATEGLARRLAADQVSAVLQHERAHLAGRHHLLVAWAEAMAAAMPFVPLFRDAPRAIRELVELAADNAAVSKYGSDAVRAALLTVSGVGVPATALGVADEDMDRRLARLESPSRGRRRWRRAASCGATGTAAVTMPFLVGSAVLLTLGALACPLVMTL